MKLTDFFPAIVEWAYAVELVRRLGFPSEDIYFVVHLNSPTVIDNNTDHRMEVDGSVISLVLRTQGKEFVWALGVTKMPKDKIQAEYDKFCEEWNAGRVEASLEEFTRSDPFQQAGALVETLLAKGFTLRPVP